MLGRWDEVTLYNMKIFTDEGSYCIFVYWLYLSLQSFGEKFLEDNLKPFYKSDPIPEKVSFIGLLQSMAKP